jgi:hypothetical protein
MTLPGGSPGPHANIPAPWRLIIILAGFIITIILGTLILKTLRYADEEKGKTIEEWSIEWSQNHTN